MTQKREREQNSLKFDQPVVWYYRFQWEGIVVKKRTTAVNDNNDNNNALLQIYTFVST